MFKKVLVATDFSPCAQRALELACSRFPQAEIKVLHVVTEDSPFTATEALLELEMLVSDVWKGETGLPGHEVARGSPTQQVVESAKTWGCRPDCDGGKRAGRPGLGLGSRRGGAGLGDSGAHREGQ